MIKSKNIDPNTDIATILRDMSSSSNFVNKIIKKAEKEAKKGKDSIKVRVSAREARVLEQLKDHVRDPKFYGKPNLTPMISALLERGFSLDIEKDFAFFPFQSDHVMTVVW